MRRTDRVVGGAAAIVAFDLATKFAAVSLVDGRRFGVIAPTHNDAFSLGIASSGRAVVLGLGASALVAAVLGTALVMRRSDLPAWIPAFVLGGAASNLIDRTAFGSVHDFFVVPPVVLNVADVAVVAGLVGYGRWRRSRRQAAQLAVQHLRETRPRLLVAPTRPSRARPWPGARPRPRPSRRSRARAGT